MHLCRLCRALLCFGRDSINRAMPPTFRLSFRGYCHSKATSQIYVPLTNITHPLGHRSKFHSFGYLTDVNSVTRGNTFLVHISWGRHWQKVAKLNWDCWPLQFPKRTVSYSPWVKEVTEAILRRLWWGGCQGWNRRTSWLRPSSPEMQKRANRSDIGSNSSGPALFLLILDIFTLILGANFRRFYNNVVHFYDKVGHFISLGG